MKNTLRLLTLLLLSLTLLCAIGCEKTPADPAESDTETTTESEKPVVLSEYFVSLDGSDENDGSEAAPFATPEKAVMTIRALHQAGHHEALTVTFKPGIYNVKNISLTEEDSGTPDASVTFRSSGEGAVVFDAGRTITGDRLSPVADDENASRFAESVRGSIYVCDLAAEGLTADDVFPALHTIGTYSNYTIASNYNGQNEAVYVDDQRQSLARFPNKGAPGDASDRILISSETVIDAGNADIGPTLRIPEDAAERVAGWQSLEDVWGFGYYSFTWADEAIRLTSFDDNENSLTFEWMCWGQLNAVDDPKLGFWLYNIPEELDVPGEYWVDRTNMKLYLYVEGDPAAHTVCVSTSPDTILSGSVSNVTIDGVTFANCAGNGLYFTGSGITVKNCVIKNVDNWAVNMEGSDGLIYGCEAYNLGKGGFYLKGGDQATLTPGNIVAENNYIHDFSQIYTTYQPAITLFGVGLSAIHNELAYGPHDAFSLGGQLNKCEWNYIHDVTQEATDAGACYQGGMLQAAGNEFNHNKIENVYGVGIYFDDGMCGCSAFGNIFENVGQAFIVGGGREISICNNLVLGPSDCAFLYFDARMISICVDETRPERTVPETNPWWQQLTALPFREGVWAETFPLRALCHFDKENTEDPNYFANPAHCVVKDNIFIGEKHRWTYTIEDPVYQYSEIEKPYISKNFDQVFEAGTYAPTKVAKRAVPGFVELPMDGYGVYDDFVKQG